MGLVSIFRCLYLHAIFCLLVGNIIAENDEEFKRSANNNLGKKIPSDLSNHILLNNEYDRTYKNDRTLMSNPKCKDSFSRLCSSLKPYSDDLSVLECLQSDKVTLLIMTFLILINESYQLCVRSCETRLLAFYYYLRV